VPPPPWAEKKGEKEKKRGKVEKRKRKMKRNGGKERDKENKTKLINILCRISAVFEKVLKVDQTRRKVPPP